MDFVGVLILVMLCPPILLDLDFGADHAARGPGKNGNGKNEEEGVHDFLSREEREDGEGDFLG